MPGVGFFYAGNLKSKWIFYALPLVFPTFAGLHMANIDYTKGPEDILIDLINDANPDNTLTLAQVALSTPSIVTDGTEVGPSFNNRKTKLTVSAIPGSGYSESVDVQYNRLHYRDVFPTTDADTIKYPVSTHTFDLADHTKLSDLVPQINQRYGLTLSADDFWEMPLPTFEGLPPYDDKFVKLEALPASKIFIGGVQLKVNPNPFDLANMPVTTLNGLVYPTWQVKFTNFVTETMDGGPGVAFW
jgi:hypothetical protein